MDTFSNDLSLYPEFDVANEGLKDVASKVAEKVNNLPVVQTLKKLAKAFGNWLRNRVNDLIALGKKLKQIRDNAKTSISNVKGLGLISDISKNVISMSDGIYQCLLDISDTMKKYCPSNDDTAKFNATRQKMQNVLKSLKTTENKIKDLPKIEMDYDTTKTVYTCLNKCLATNSKLQRTVDAIDTLKQNQDARTSDKGIWDLLNKFTSLYGNLRRCLQAFDAKLIKHRQDQEKSNEGKENQNMDNSVNESIEATYESIVAKVYEDLYDEAEESVDKIFDELDAANEKAVDYDASLYSTKYNPSKFVITPNTLKEFGIPSNRADELFDALCDYMAEKQYITWGRKELHDKIAAHFKETRKITAKEITVIGWKYFNKAAKLLKKSAKDGNVDPKEIIERANKKVLKSASVGLVGKTVLELVACSVAGVASGLITSMVAAPIVGTPTAVYAGRITAGINVVKDGAKVVKDYSTSKKSLNKVVSRS